MPAARRLSLPSYNPAEGEAAGLGPNARSVCSRTCANQ